MSGINCEMVYMWTWLDIYKKKRLLSVNVIHGRIGKGH